MIGVCMYNSFQGGYVAVDEGNGVGGYHSKTQNECEALCDKTGNCKSFAYCEHGRSCWLKDKKVNDNELKNRIGTCTTYYHECNAGKYLYYFFG